MILLDSTISNLNGLALGVATKKPVCLCGPVGCGKTALVQHLASITGEIALRKKPEEVWINMKFICLLFFQVIQAPTAFTEYS